MRYKIRRKIHLKWDIEEGRMKGAYYMLSLHILHHEFDMDVGMPQGHISIANVYSIWRKLQHFIYVYSYHLLTQTKL